MENTGTRFPETSSTRAGVAGLFQNESQAERALDELKSAGFSENEIGVATAHDQGKIGSFWDKLSSKFGKHEHTEDVSDFHDSLTESGVPEHQARYFNSTLGRGGVLVTVHCGPDRSAQARSILERNGADLGSDVRLNNSTVPSGSIEQGQQRIQLLGEILRVHKEWVSRGEVRLRKEVVTEQQNIEVPTTREELVIERVQGSGREAAGDEVGSGQKEIRVPLREERVQVEKKPVVNEEIRVGKRQVQDSKQVTDQVRHEELRSDTEGNVDDSTTRALRDKEKTRRSA